MKITARHKRLIVELLRQPSIKKAANEAGITERTAHNWLNDSDFRQALATAEDELLQSVARQMTQASNEALAVLRAVFADEESTVRERIAAARTVLASLPNIRLLGSIERRLSEIESEK